MKKLILLTLCSAFAGALPALADDHEDGEQLNREPRNCVQLRQIRQSHVLDDNTIVFEMIGRRYYLNNLPNRCPRLGFEKSFSYATSITQLCNVDIITVIQNFGGRLVPGPACGLGMFEPITKDEFKSIKADKKAKKKKGDEEGR